MADEIVIRDDTEGHRYVVEAGGNQVGMAVYHMRGGRHFFVHTEISEHAGGRGLGTKLVKFALDDVRAQGGSVVPICPFFAAYIKRHPEYDDIVDHDILRRIESAEERGSGSDV